MRTELKVNLTMVGGTAAWAERGARSAVDALEHRLCLRGSAGARGLGFRGGFSRLRRCRPRAHSPPSVACDVCEVLRSTTISEGAAPEVLMESSADQLSDPDCSRARCDRPYVRVPVSYQCVREGAPGRGAKPLGDRAIEPLIAHLSRAYACDRADTLSAVHRSMPDAGVPDASI